MDFDDVSLFDSECQNTVEFKKENLYINSKYYYKFNACSIKVTQ